MKKIFQLICISTSLFALTSWSNEQCRMDNNDCACFISNAQQQCDIAIHSKYCYNMNYVYHQLLSVGAATACREENYRPGSAEYVYCVNLVNWYLFESSCEK